MSDAVTREIARVLRQNHQFLLTAHTSPDGDSLGSLLAFGLALQDLGKQVVLCVDSIPDSYRFLPGSTRLQLWSDQTPASPAVLIAIDCATPERLGGGQVYLTQAGRIINIDHHISNPGYGDINYVDPTAAAAGEQVFLVLEALGAVVTPPIATCLYAAIAADTGSFRYASTTPRTHRIAAALLSVGIDLEELNRNLFETRSLPQTRLLALALETLTISPGGKVAWAVVSLSMLAQAGLTDRDTDTEGMIGFVRAVEGVEVAMLFREQSEGVVRVGLRSRRDADVNALAAGFGGGGHRRAAGCTLEGSLDAVRERVVAAARKVVKD